jgi:hypothetical protein
VDNSTTVFISKGKMVLQKNFEQLKHHNPETDGEDIEWLLLTIPSLIEWEGLRLW